MATIFIAAIRPSRHLTRRAHFDLQHGNLIVRNVEWHETLGREWIEAPQGVEFDPIVADDAAILAALHEFCTNGGRRTKVIKPTAASPQLSLL
jgi:hypothetical protein